jgi:8-oxo-dGTP diphosphatase
VNGDAGDVEPGAQHRCVAGVLVREGRVLLAHRSPSRRWYPGVWDLPGGHVGAGETETAALVRELREELGVRTAPPAGPPDAEFDGPGLRLTVWVVRTWQEAVVNGAPDEHDELRWVRPEELPALDLAHPGYLPLLTVAASPT